MSIFCLASLSILVTELGSQGNLHYRRHESSASFLDDGAHVKQTWGALSEYNRFMNLLSSGAQQQQPIKGEGPRAILATMVGAPANHILFIVAASPAVQQSLLTGLQLSESVYGPINLPKTSVLSTDSMTLDYVELIEAASYHHATTRQARELLHHVWTTGIVMVPTNFTKKNSEMFWIHELIPLIQYLVKQRQTQVSLVWIQEYIPTTVTRQVTVVGDLEACAVDDRNIIQEAVKNVFKITQLFHQIKIQLLDRNLFLPVVSMTDQQPIGFWSAEPSLPTPRRVNVDQVRIESLIENAYAMERWMIESAGVCPSTVPRANILRRSGYGELTEPAECSLALPTTLKYITSLSLNQIWELPALDHLRLWNPRKTNMVGFFKQLILKPAPAFKIIVITQVRNVGLTLLGFLKSVDWIADHIIIYDTGSTDNTVQLARSFEDPSSSILQAELTLLQSTTTISPAEPQGTTENNADWHEGKVYKKLLDAARQLGATHILSPDSDEYFSYNWRRNDLLKNMLLSLPKAVGLRLRLFHVYEGTDEWIVRRPDHWGQHEFAPLAWADDGVADRGPAMHHLPRNPVDYLFIDLPSQSLGAVHFKFVNHEGTLVRLMWNKHLEWRQGHTKRATSDFYDLKMPHIGGGDSDRQLLAQVPKEDWYGPFLANKAPCMRKWINQWLEPSTWIWRLRMVNQWRTEASFPFDLPEAWPFGITFLLKTAKDNHINSAAISWLVHKGGSAPQKIDQTCRKQYTIAAAAAGKITKVTEKNISFQWAANHDSALEYQKIKTEETHLIDFVHLHHLGNQQQQQQQQHNQTSVSPPPMLMLDVGANNGYYGLWAKAAGYEVIFIEPRPFCVWNLEMSLMINAWQATILKATADAETSSSLPGNLPVWCLSDCRRNYPQQEHTTPADGYRPSVRLDDVVPLGRRVWMMRIDIRASEAGILAGAHRLFSKHHIMAAMVRVWPQVQPNALTREMTWIQDQAYDLFRPRSLHPKNSRRDYQRLSTKADIQEYFHRILFESPSKGNSQDILIVLRSASLRRRAKKKQ